MSPVLPIYRPYFDWASRYANGKPLLALFIHIFHPFVTTKPLVVN